MRALFALGVAAILLGSVAACKGSDSATPGPLGPRDFTNKVAAAIVTSSDLQAEPIFGLKVDVSAPNGLDTLQLVLNDAYRRYRAAAPDNRQAIVGGLVQDVVTRMSEGNAKRSFADVRARLMPMLKRRTVVAGSADSPAVTPFDDLSVVYGVQEENSFMVVSKADVERWGGRLSQIHALALANLERETNKGQKLLCEPSGGQKLCGWASGDGYDATRMLVPGLRRQIVRQLGGPAVYAVPLESVFVALTRDYAKLIKVKVLQEFTTGKNPLSPELFVERNGRLVALPK